jgi:hypothetical protein
LFFEELLNNDITFEGIDKIHKYSNGLITIRGASLFKKYTEWAQDNRFTKDWEPDIRQFYTRIQNEEVSLLKRRGYTFITFHPKDLHQYMFDKLWIDGDETVNMFAPKKEEDDDKLADEFENYF